MVTSLKVMKALIFCHSLLFFLARSLTGVTALCYFFSQYIQQLYTNISSICKHARIQAFSSGGPPGQTDKKTLTFFCCFFSFRFFFCHQLVLQKSNGQFQSNRSFFKVPEGVQYFLGVGVKLYQGGGGGSNCLFPIETHITCDFPGGIRTPCPPCPPPL